MPKYLHITPVAPVINLSGLDFDHQARTYTETRQRAIDNPDKGVRCRFMIKEYVRLVAEDKITGWSSKSTWFALAS